MFNIRKYSLIVVCSVFSALLGCKRYAEPPAKYEDYNPAGVVNSKRKVLLVSFDGVSGELLSGLQLPTIDSLLKSSKYTYAQTLELQNTEASGWKSIMTGTSYTKNGVFDSTFTPKPPVSDDGVGYEHSAPPYYPTFLSYMAQIQPDVNFYAISSWERLSSSLFKEATESFVTANDQITKDSAVQLLARKTTDGVIVDFNGANIIGKQSGYVSSNERYLAAVRTLDGYLREMLATINGRDWKENEEWLVILTSGNGGVDKNGGSQKGFQIYSSKYFSKAEVKNNSMLSVAFKGKEGSATTAESVDSLSQFDLGPLNKEMTISFKVNINVDVSYNWPTILSKRKSINTGASDAGWCFFLENDFWQFAISNGSSSAQLAGTSIRDGRWHDLSVVVDFDGTKRYIRTYTDGVYNATKEITSFGNMVSSNNLIIGYIPQYSPSAPVFEMADIRIFNTALSDDIIKNNVCLSTIQQHPNYNNLKGFWRADDGIGPRLKSSMRGVGDFWMKNSYAWLTMEQYPCSIVNPIVGGDNSPSILAQSADIAPNILTWFRIDIDSDWGMDGHNWLYKFASEYIKSPSNGSADKK